MRVVFLRHGESAYNCLGLCNADPAVPVLLTETGRAQAEAAALGLAGAGFSRVYVSRLDRARETAEIVNRRHGARIIVDDRLDDRRTGLEGRPVAEYLGTMAAAPDPLAWKAPGGESYLEMVARVHAFLDELEATAEASSSPVLVVSHHEPLQAVAGRYRGLDPAAMWRVWLGNGEWLDYDVNPDLHHDPNRLACGLRPSMAAGL